MPKYSLLFLLFFSFSTIAQQNIDEELVIFIQKTKESDYTNKNLKELQDFMKSQGVPTKFINIEATGAPAEVGFTPFVVYRNYLGNKIYKGRYATHKRLLNFIRTVRRMPIEEINYEEENVFVWKHPRANLFLKLKVTEPSGNVPAKLKSKKFKQQYLKGLKEGFEQLEYVTSTMVGNSDELMYCNFYPYIAEDGKVYVSTEIYSHYDCHTPIYQQFETAAVGNSIQQGFAAAASQLFERIQKEVVNSENGDAMNFLDAAIPTVSWESLSLKTLEAPKRQTNFDASNISYPKKWVVQGAADPSTPILSFHFPAPLRQYGGELDEVTGTITLDQQQNLAAATGEFEVAVSSIEMGESMLTQAVKESMLYVDKYPKATLVFKRIIGDQLDLKLGQITQAQVEATLTMLEKSSTITATAQFEPILDDAGELVLFVNTKFSVQQLSDIYGVDGPDGPKEAKNTLIFNANFLMKAAAKK